MNKIISKNIRQILLPVMKEHGFTHTFYSDCCVFVKRNEEGGKLERITVTQFEYDKRIKIEIDIRPTYLHLPFVDEKDILIENQKVKKASLEGWIYKTEEDIRQILEMIKESLEKKGFEYLDTILNDPADLYPTCSEYKDMYENHEKYLKDFKEKYDFDETDTGKALETLQKALDDFPDRITEENRSQLLPVIAAYGAIFAAKGGRWTWNENSKKSMISYPHKDLSVDAIILPAAEIYGGIQGNRKHSICEALAKELTCIE